MGVEEHWGIYYSIVLLLLDQSQEIIKFNSPMYNPVVCVVWWFSDFSPCLSLLPLGMAEFPLSDLHPSVFRPGTRCHEQVLVHSRHIEFAVVRE